MSENSIGDRLRDALTKCGMSMKFLSDQAGLPYSSIQNYAADKQAPGAEALQKIRRTAGINIDWLLTGEGSPFADPSRELPRPLELRDYRELRARFTNFDEVFSLRNAWELMSDDERAEHEVTITRAFARHLLRERPDLSFLLAGQDVESLSIEQTLQLVGDLVERWKPRSGD